MARWRDESRAIRVFPILGSLLVLPRLAVMLFLRDRLWKGMRVGGLFMLSACASDTTAPNAVDLTTSVPVRSSMSLRAVNGTGESGAVRNVWMGAHPAPISQVRVVDYHGKPVAGAPVRFRSRRIGHSARDSVIAIEATAVSDIDGLATLHDVTFPVRDTVADMYIVTATLLSDTTAVVDSRIRAWRDVSRFGGGAPLVFSTMPVPIQHVRAILPLGTFNVVNALPSADAIVVPAEGRRPVVHAMADGIVTELNTVRGEITVRVRDSIRVRMSGLDVRTTLWVGAVVREGDSLGTTRDATPESSGLAVRVLDASVQRAHWIRPERYGARRNAAFFVRYLADGLRSNAYALVQRAGPDLSGTIDYDRPGKLVGTWFDPTAPATIGNATVTGASPLLFLSTAQQLSEADPSAALDEVALTFAYDAQSPGEIRIATGSRLGQLIGASGVRAVAWEDPDPAVVSVASGLVRYHLFDRADGSRIGSPPQRLLVQLIDSEHLRVEVVAGDVSDAGFTSRSVVLIR